MFILYLNSAPEKEKSQAAHIAVFVVDHTVDLVARQFQREQFVKETVRARHHTTCSYSAHLKLSGLGSNLIVQGVPQGHAVPPWS